MDRRSLLFLTLLAVAVFAFGVKRLGWGQTAHTFPPPQNKRIAAVGNLANLKPEIRRAFEVDPELAPNAPGSFQPKHKPRESDWLAQHREVGQTFDQYLRGRPNLPNSLRKAFYILPLGDFDPKKSPDLDTLAEAAAAYFHPMEIKLLPPVPAAKVPAESRERKGAAGRYTQWLTSDILAWMRPRLPKDAYAMIAVTMTDLYPQDSWNFVFGQATIHHRVGLFSFARYHPSFQGQPVDKDTPKLVLTRATKVLTHEAGHMFGIKHCVFYECNMAGSNHLQETDDAPLHLCPVCLRKLHHAQKFDPVQRYNKLLAFYQKAGLEDAATWVRARLAAIDE